MRFHAFLSGEPEQTPPASSPARVRRMGCCMAWKGNCFVKYRDEYLGLLSVFCPVCWTKKEMFFHSCAVGRTKFCQIRGI